MKQFELKSFDGKEYLPSTLTFEMEGGIAKITFECSVYKISGQDNYPFSALLIIRKELEKMEFKILCNGSRLDVYPSGAALGSLKAYALKMGKVATRNDLVSIFEATNDVRKIATVDEQKEYYRKWLDSVRSYKKDL
jgi:hypothetical protein